MPQGSVIGPAEYIVYTEELDSIIRPRKFDHHMYADDIQLLSVMSLAEVPQFRSKIENCILAVRDWCSSRRLTLNPDKTELIWFASSSNLKKLQYISTNLHLETLEIVPSSTVTVRDLGVYLDSSLDMRVHINKIVFAGFYHLRRLRQLRHVLNRERRQKLVSALILSRVDYCNSVLVGLPLNTISPLRRLLNAAARFVAGLRSIEIM